MNQVEYFYNIIYYFFYRAIIKFALFVRGRYNPLIFILYLFYNIPYIRNRFKEKGIYDPLKWHLGYDKKVEDTSIGNPKGSAGTIIGASGPMLITFFLYMSIYHIILYLFFPTFQDNFGYVVTIVAILSFLTDVILSQVNNKGEKYIKEFNKRKGWWRTKWKIITILSLFLSFWFSLTTSSGGNVGQFLISLHF